MLSLLTHSDPPSQTIQGNRMHPYSNWPIKVSLDELHHWPTTFSCWWQSLHYNLHCNWLIHQVHSLLHCWKWHECWATGRDFLHNILKNHEVSNSIISDCEFLFNSQYWNDFCQTLKIKNLLSIANHLQTDGSMEWINQMLKHYLRIFTSYQQNDWATLLSFLYNNNLHSATRMIPFYANYGYHSSTYSDPDLNYNLQAASIEEHLEKIKQVHIEIDRSLQYTQATYTKYYDKKCQSRSFSISDHVILSTKNLTTGRPFKKLNNKFFGPFKIIATWGSNAYTLQLLKQYFWIHPTFYVSLLKPYNYCNSKALHEPQLIIKVNSVEWEIDTMTSASYAKKPNIWSYGKVFPHIRISGWQDLGGYQKLFKEFNLKYEDAPKPMKCSWKWTLEHDSLFLWNWFLSLQYSLQHDSGMLALQQHSRFQYVLFFLCFSYWVWEI